MRRKMFDFGSVFVQGAALQEAQEKERRRSLRCAGRWASSARNATRPVFGECPPLTNSGADPADITSR